MKLVILMYLRDDDACVERLLAEARVPVYSRMEMEGAALGPGPGWYGESAPYRSQMILSVVSDEVAASLLAAVEDCRGVEDPEHPIRALQLPVERMTSCRCDG